MSQACKAIFITGGGSGIGRAVALHFAAKGWFVGVADLNAEGVGETQRLLPAGRSSAHVMDVRDRDAWARELDAFVAASGGRLDVLFNNAGIAVGGDFADTPLEDLDRLVAINLTGVINGAHIGYRHLKASPGGGCLLNTASAAGIYGTGGAAVYSATKFGVRGLTEALDGEWAKAGIRVRSIMPGFIDTPLLDAGVTGSNENVRERVRAAGLEFTPLGTVAQLAWAAVHGDQVHMVIGKTARRMRFAARWMPGALRKQARGRVGD